MIAVSLALFEICVVEVGVTSVAVDFEAKGVIVPIESVGPAICTLRLYENLRRTANCQRVRVKK